MVKCSKDMIRPVEAYADQMRGEAVRTIAALTVVINSLSGVPGHRALLFVSDGISVTPGEELYQAASELCDGSNNGTRTSTGDLVPLAEKKGEMGDGGRGARALRPPHRRHSTPASTASSTASRSSRRTPAPTG